VNTVERIERALESADLALLSPALSVSLATVTTYISVQGRTVHLLYYT